MVALICMNTHLTPSLYPTPPPTLFSPWSRKHPRWCCHQAISAHRVVQGSGHKQADAHTVACCILMACGFNNYQRVRYSCAPAAVVSVSPRIQVKGALSLTEMMVCETNNVGNGRIQLWPRWMSLLRKIYRCIYLFRTSM